MSHTCVGSPKWRARSQTFSRFVHKRFPRHEAKPRQRKLIAFSLSLSNPGWMCFTGCVPVFSVLTRIFILAERERKFAGNVDTIPTQLNVAINFELSFLGRHCERNPIVKWTLEYFYSWTWRWCGEGMQAYFGHERTLCKCALKKVARRRFLTSRCGEFVSKVRTFRISGAKQCKSCLGSTFRHSTVNLRHSARQLKGKWARQDDEAADKTMRT